MYGKVFAQIFDGTLHGRLEATAVFMAMIAIADQDGAVNLTLTALASRTGWPQKFIAKGIKELEQPDEESRSPDEDGRRIIRLRENTVWGWRIVNYRKYREIRNESSRREYMREYMRKRRCEQPLADVNNSKQQLAQAEAEAEANKETPKTRKRRKVTLPESFALTADLTAYIGKAIPDADPEALFAKFTDQAAAGAWEYADWSKAFRGYVRNCAPKSGHFAAGQYPRRGADGIVWE